MIGHGADHAVDGRADVQQVDLALQLGHDRTLALDQQEAVARVEGDALSLQSVILLRVGDADFGLLQCILRARDIDLRDRAAFEGPLVAFQVALRGDAFDLRLIEQLARVGARELRVQRGAACLGFEAGERALFLGQAAAQLGAVDFRQRLVALDRVARAHLEGYGAGRRCVERGAHRGDHPALDGDVAHQGAPADIGEAQAFGADRLVGAQPAAEGGNGEGEQQRSGNAAADD